MSLKWPMPAPKQGILGRHRGPAQLQFDQVVRDNCTDGKAYIATDMAPKITQIIGKWRANGEKSTICRQASRPQDLALHSNHSAY
nr:hypothetical protein [Pseudomonas benzenivorans]